MQASAKSLEPQTQVSAHSDLEEIVSLSSHQLREPVRQILAYAQLIREDQTQQRTGDIALHLEHIQENGQRIQSIVEGLAAFARLRTRDLNLAPTNLKTILDGTLLELQKDIERAGCSVTCDPLPTVLAEEAILARVLQHLLANALKFRAGRPLLVHVSARPDGADWVLVSVRDSGMGIDRRYLEKCLGLFQRLHSRSDYPGEGLGLAFCKAAVERYGGRIWIEPNPDHGITVNFSLPRAD